MYIYISSFVKKSQFPLPDSVSINGIPYEYITAGNQTDSAQSCLYINEQMEAICLKSERFTEIWRLMEQIEALIAQRYLRNISAECGIEMG